MTARKLTTSQRASLAAATRWHGTTPEEREKATRPAREAWMEKHGKPMLLRMSHQAHGRLTRKTAPVAARAAQSPKGEDS